jgi:hypothetical protein
VRVGRCRSAGLAFGDPRHLPARAPRPGAQLSFTDHNGYRFQVFITDQTDVDLARLGDRPPAEDQIRCADDTGLRTSGTGCVDDGW